MATTVTLAFLDLMLKYRGGVDLNLLWPEDTMGEAKISHLCSRSNFFLA